MHGNHGTLANFSLILGAGMMIVIGSAFVLWSQAPKAADFLKARARPGVRKGLGRVSDPNRTASTVA